MLFTYGWSLFCRHFAFEVDMLISLFVVASCNTVLVSSRLYKCKGQECHAKITNLDKLALCFPLLGSPASLVSVFQVI